jgi:hypothetical protein
MDVKRQFGLTYDDAVGAVVSKAEAVAEIRRHGHDPAEFFAEIGERDQYVGFEVLDWLGY